MSSGWTHYKCCESYDDQIYSAEDIRICNYQQAYGQRFINNISHLKTCISTDKDASLGSTVQDRIRHNCYIQP